MNETARPPSDCADPDRWIEASKTPTPAVDLSTLIAELSHTLRTPLNPVLGFIELLLDTELDDAQRHYLEQAQNGALEMCRTLNQLTSRRHGCDPSAM